MWVAPQRHRLDEYSAQHGIIQSDDFVSKRLFQKLEVLRKAIGISTESQGRCLRKVFDSFDLDGSGGIDEYELRLAFKEVGLLSVSKAQMSFFMGIMDQDSSGTASGLWNRALCVFYNY